MEKHVSAVAYWLGLIFTVIALICRAMIAFEVVPLRIGSAGGVAISYLSFFHGAVLFFLLSIASWCRSAKS
jgi:hydrogenase-4 membrane subunit HyfE